MTYKDLMDYYNDSEALAGRAIGVPRQTVHRWKNIPRIPTDQQIAYEGVTAGALKADLPESVRAA